MKKKLKITEYLKTALFVLIFIVASVIFSDWEQFKSGLFGISPDF